MKAVSHLGWALDHVTLDGQPLDFERYPFQVEVFEASDLAEVMVVMGSAQCGKSYWAASESIYFPDARGFSGIYYFPTDPPVRGHVYDKINPIVNGSTYLRSRVRDPGTDRDSVDSISIKRVGRGFARYRGAKSVHNRQSTPADIVWLDEYDRFDLDWVPDIEKRLNASPWKYWRLLCVPTFVEGPIHAAYQDSDQRAWIIACDHCDHRQDLDWFRDVVAQEGEHSFTLRDLDWSPEDSRDPHVFCESCSRPVNRLGPGMWIQRNPRSHVVGFHLHRLVTHTATIRELWGKFDRAVRSGDEGDLTLFYNGDLGLPYTPKGAGLTDELLNQARRKYLMPQRIDTPEVICTAGFDVQGDERLVGRISRIIHQDGQRIRQAVWIGNTSWTELPELLSRFPIRVAVIDGKYDPTACRRAQQQDRRIWLAYYPGKDNPKSVMLDPVHDSRQVTVQRTASLNRSHGELISGVNHLPSNAHLIKNFYEEMKAIKRVEEEDSRGNRISVWRKAKADDYRHADNYDFVAAELLAAGIASTPTAAVSGVSRRAQAVGKVVGKRT